MSNKTAVLIAGCHLQANYQGQSWEQIVWGSEEAPNFYGRAMMGLHVALQNDAKLVIFSTGASEREGIREGQYTKAWAISHVEQIKNPLKAGGQALLDYLNRSEVDIESQNTKEEANRNLDICIKRGITRLYVVSSPWHIERYHAEILSVAEEFRQRGTGSSQIPEIFAVASWGTAKDVVVVEPSHRGDRPFTHWQDYVRRFYKVAGVDIPRFEEGLENFLSSFGL